jgi:hypothetical protein
LWFMGLMVPVIGLVQVGEQAMADRYTYLSLIGPAFSLGCWLVEVAGTNRPALPSRRVAEIFGLCLVVLLTFLTRHQLAYWTDTISLFEHAVAVTADNPAAQFAIGVGLEKSGDASKAMVRYRVATAIDPTYHSAYYNMGQLLRKRACWPEAAEAYLRAAAHNPNDVATELNLASVLPHVGRFDDAVLHFEKALSLDPDSIEALNNLAWLLSTCNDPGTRDGARAVQLAERGCALTRSKAPFFLGTLAAAYAEAGRFSDAIATAEKACALAQEAGDTITVAKNKELLELYRAHRPVRDSMVTK